MLVANPTFEEQSPGARTPLRAAVAGRTGSPALGSEAPGLEAARGPATSGYHSSRPQRQPPPVVLKPAAGALDAFPPPYPNSQPVSFLISSSSSSRSNVEARDPITEPGAPPGAGAPQATEVAEGRRKAGKGQGSGEGTQGLCAREGVPEGSQ